MSDAKPAQQRVAAEKPVPSEAAFLAAFAAKGATTDKARAALLGMPRRSVYRYIKGEVDPGLGKARWIARQLDTRIDVLWPAA